MEKLSTKRNIRHPRRTLLSFGSDYMRGVNSNYGRCWRRWMPLFNWAAAAAAMCRFWSDVVIRERDRINATRPTPRVSGLIRLWSSELGGNAARGSDCGLESAESARRNLTICGETATGTADGLRTTTIRADRDSQVSQNSRFNGDFFKQLQQDACTCLYHIRCLLSTFLLLYQIAVILQWLSHL